MLTDLKVLMLDTKSKLNKLSSLLDEQYEVILEKDIIRMSELEKEISSTTKEIANLELKRREIIGTKTNFNEVLKELDNAELLELQKEIGIVISMLQIQKDSNMKLLKQLLYFSNKMISALRPVDEYGSTYNSKGLIK